MTHTHVRSLADYETEMMPGGMGIKIRVIGEAEGARHVEVHINTLKPPRKGPYHYHAHSENVYIILSGRGRVILDGATYEVKKDDVVFIPPNTRHSLTNVADEDLTVLEVYGPPIYRPSRVDFVVERP